MEEKSLKQRLEELERKTTEPTTKPFRMPFRGRVGNGKIKKGYVTIVTIQDNHAVDFTKEQIIDGTIKLSKGDLSIHSLDPKDIFFYKNKPLIFQPKKSLNPYNPLKGEHETYGQKYVMARMEGDKLSLKKSIGWMGSIIGIVILGIIAYAFITGA